MNALVYVDIDQSIHKGKMKVALNEKRKKLRGFSFYINMANFEALFQGFLSRRNCLFLNCSRVKELSKVRNIIRILDSSSIR